MSSFESYPRISPFLWFDSNAEEAVEFYLSVFKNSRRLGGITEDSRSPEKVRHHSLRARRPDIYSAQRRPDVQIY